MYSVPRNIISITCRYVGKVCAFVLIVALVDNDIKMIPIALKCVLVIWNIIDRFFGSCNYFARPWRYCVISVLPNIQPGGVGILIYINDRRILLRLGLFNPDLFVALVNINSICALTGNVHRSACCSCTCRNSRRRCGVS